MRCHCRKKPNGSETPVQQNLSYSFHFPNAAQGIIPSDKVKHSRHAQDQKDVCCRFGPVVLQELLPRRGFISYTRTVAPMAREANPPSSPHGAPYTNSHTCLLLKESLAHTVSSYSIFSQILCNICSMRINHWQPLIFTLMILTSLYKMVTAKKSAEVNSFRRFLQRKGEKKKIPFCQEQIQTIQEFLGAWVGFVWLLLLLIHSH